MPQLSLYVDDATLGVLKEGAAREGVSMSRFAADAIRDQGRNAWPAGFFDTYGSIADESFAAPSDVDSRLDEAVCFA